MWDESAEGLLTFSCLFPGLLAQEAMLFDAAVCRCSKHKGVLSVLTLEVSRCAHEMREKSQFVNEVTKSAR